MRAFLRLRRAGAVGAFGPGENAARGEEEDVAVGELLFEFARQAEGRGSGGSVVFGRGILVVWGGERKGKGGKVPLLDFMEAREEGHWDEDDDCFFAVADFELWVGEEGEAVSLRPANSKRLWCDGKWHSKEQSSSRWTETARQSSARNKCFMIVERNGPYLASRHELQRPQRGLHVRDIRL